MIFAKTGGVLTFVLLCDSRSESQRQHKSQHSSTGVPGAKRHAQNEIHRFGFLLIEEGAFEKQGTKRDKLTNSAVARQMN